MKSSLSSPDPLDRIEIVQARPKIAGPRVGRIVSCSMGTSPVVDFVGNPLAPRAARCIGSIGSEMLMRWHRESLPVLLVFEASDASRPIIVDVVVGPVDVHRADPDPERVPVSRISATRPVTSTPERNASGVLPARLGCMLRVEDGVAVVDVGEPTPVRARSAIALRNMRDPVVVIDAGDHGAVIIGQIHPQLLAAADAGDQSALVLRGARVTIEADTQLILKSGSSMLRIDASGKLVTMADEIVSTARVSNKIRGGSVQLN